MWRKNFRVRKFQTVLLFLVIMLCTSLLNTSVGILVSLDKPYQQLRDECQSMDMVCYPYSLELEAISQLKKNLEELPEVEKVEAVDIYNITEEMKCNEKKIECFAYISKYSKDVFKQVKVVDSNNGGIDQLKDGECYLPQCIANENDIKVGDKIQFDFSNGAKSYTIAGIFSEPYSGSTAFSSYIMVKEMPEGISYKQNLFINMKDGVSRTDLEKSYRQEHDGKIDGTFKTVDEIIGNYLLTGKIMGGIFLAIGIIMLIVSGLIINFMVRNCMYQDAKNIAIYKTMGYEHKTILGMYQVFYGVIALISCFVGMFGGMFITNEILKDIFANVGSAASVNPFISGIPCMLVTCCFVLLITGLIINKTKNVKPINALTGTSNTNTKKKHYKGNSTMQFGPFGLAIRRMVRNKKAMIGIIITAFTSIYGVNFGMIALDTAMDMKNQNDYWLGIDPCDVILTVSDASNNAIVEDYLKNDTKVRNFLNCDLGDYLLTLPWKEGMKITQMTTYIYEDYSLIELPLVEGRNPKEANEIALGTVVSDALEKEVGDYIEVYLPNNEKVNLLITGLFQTYYCMGETCRISESTLTAHSCNLNYKNYSIYLKDGEDVMAYMNELAANLGNLVTITKRTEMFDAIMSMITTPQEQAIPGVTALLILIGVINIFCIILLKNKELFKENTIYKAMGYSTGHLVLSNIIYVFLISITTCVIALPINLLTHEKIMKLGVSMFGFRAFPITINLLHLILLNLLILVVFILSTLISSHSIKHIKVQELVYE